MSADAQVRHAAFYASCQALLYVLCYHMEPLLRSRHRPPAGGAPPAAGGGASAAAPAAPSSLGPSGGTPASLGPSGGTPSSLQSTERRTAVHAQREACADAVRQLFSQAGWVGLGGQGSLPGPSAPPLLAASRQLHSASRHTWRAARSRAPIVLPPPLTPLFVGHLRARPCRSCPSCCSTPWTRSPPARAPWWQSLGGRRGSWASPSWHGWCATGSGATRAPAQSRCDRWCGGVGGRRWAEAYCTLVAVCPASCSLLLLSCTTQLAFFPPATIVSPPHHIPPHASPPAHPQHRQLELFFPFDPYLLRRSAQHLSLGATYVRWRRGHPAGRPGAGRGRERTERGGGRSMA